MDAVPCGFSAFHSGAYHSSAIFPRRTTSSPVVLWASRLLRHAASFAGSNPAEAGEIAGHGMDCPNAIAANATDKKALFIAISQLS